MQLGLDSVCLGEVATDNRGMSIITSAIIYGQPGKKSYPGIALAEKFTASKSKDDLIDKVHLGSYKQTIKIDIDGTLYVEVLFDLITSLSDLPRVGIEIALPSQLSEAIYFAEGPHENYPDRSYSSHSGVYEGMVSNSCTYVVPQEQGNRINMRWLVLAEPNGKKGLQVPQFCGDTGSTLQGAISGKQGLMIASTSEELPQFTLSQHTDTAIFSARHVNELKGDEERIFVRIDAAQRGLGSGSCGPQTLEQFKINGGKFSLSFCIKPFGNKR